MPVEGIAIPLAATTEGENLGGLVKQIWVHCFIYPVNGEGNNLIGVNRAVGSVELLRPLRTSNVTSDVADAVAIDKVVATSRVNKPSVYAMMFNGSRRGKQPRADIRWQVLSQVRRYNRRLMGRSWKALDLQSLGHVAIMKV